MQTPPWFTQNIAITPKSTFDVVNNKRYHYLSWGDPSHDKLLFIHGALANAYWYAYLAPFFINRFHVISISLPGHGQSDWQNTYAATDFIDIVNNHVDPDKRNVVIGHSMGAKIALHTLEKNHTHISELILLDPPIGAPYFKRKNSPSQRHRTYEHIDKLIERFRIIPKQPMPNPFINHYIAKHSIRTLQDGYQWQFDPNFFAKFSTLGRESYAPPSSLRSNLYLIHGEYSTITTESVISHIQSHYPSVQPILLPNAWHAIMLDQPLALTTIIESIVNN